MWTRWFPWRALVSRLARSLGFVDPIAVLSRVERMAQPAEVAEPIELLRAGVRFHARGLLNARAIQYNLDWAWPYWVERQYDPRGESFIPRGFSLTHVNLTHRNWTAVGLPDLDALPLVDPRGLVTPLYDGWSVDAWLVPREGALLLPARAEACEQRLVVAPEEAGGPGLQVETRVSDGAGRLLQRVDVIEDGGPQLRIRIRAEGGGPGWIALALRPANPEGVSSIERVERTGPATLRVDDRTDVRMGEAPERVLLSRYARGDVLSLVERAARALPTGAEVGEVGECPAGLATAAALFPLDSDGTGEVTVHVPLAGDSGAAPGGGRASGRGAEAGAAPGRAAPSRRPWRAALDGTARLQAPDERFRLLYDAAVRALVLHSPGDLYAGPFTYKRFWFRDAAFIVDALCSVGLAERARDALSRYPARQEASGYFRSQEGEWDSNGAALWALDRYGRLTGRAPPGSWIEASRKGAAWIVQKRLDREPDTAHAGLLPAGFSAEHLGPNDYYYWDDFWSVAGLRAAARIADRAGDGAAADSRWAREAEDLLDSVDRSIRRSPGHLQGGAVPASPYRRMDAGAVGSLAAGYPLRLWAPTDGRLLATAEHLLEHHTVDGAFFQDMIHAGLNPYLTLHIAQVLLRAGDSRHETLVRTVAGLASSTGQWPEAVHPRTGGGCMGDGQHLWAASEWVLMMRNWFVREEEDRLVLASGIPPDWLRGGGPVAFGPTPTPYGPLTVRVRGAPGEAVVEWTAAWRGTPPGLEVRLPGHRPADPAPGDSMTRVERTPGTRGSTGPAG